MVFIGDIAVPDGVQPQIEYIPDCFFKQKVIANLEGAIAEPGTVDISEDKLFSNANVLDFLNKCNVNGVTLANNHVLDVNGALENTKTILKKWSIECTGAGENIIEAKKEIIIDEEREKYVLIAFGWKAISCVYADDNTKGVNPLEYQNIIEIINELGDRYPDRKIIAIMHWDYELERYPMPAHRRLAKHLIDKGVEAVIGHHPHCIQGVEIYKGKPIIYSVGNWFIPGGIYMNGKLKFPDYSSIEIALEIHDNITVHAFRYDDDNKRICFISSDDIKSCKLTNELSPFVGMNDSEYEKWFKQNRCKKRLLPVFKEYNKSLNNDVKYAWLNMRQKIINLMFSAGLKKRSGTN